MRDYNGSADVCGYLAGKEVRMKDTIWRRMKSHRNFKDSRLALSCGVGSGFIVGLARGEILLGSVTGVAIGILLATFIVFIDYVVEKWER